ncbi:MAG: hypothetical protein CMJ80_10920 [Planctomycetaceae bacterium]|nr:hypothetical protein [Planctomycetaceae bacterium]
MIYQDFSDLPPGLDAIGFAFLDVTGDGYIAPQDALHVINYLNRSTPSPNRMTEGENSNVAQNANQRGTGFEDPMDGQRKQPVTSFSLVAAARPLGPVSKDPMSEVLERRLGDTFCFTTTPRPLQEVVFAEHWTDRSSSSESFYQSTVFDHSNSKRLSSPERFAIDEAFADIDFLESD